MCIWTNIILPRCWPSALWRRSLFIHFILHVALCFWRFSFIELFFHLASKKAWDTLFMFVLFYMIISHTHQLVLSWYQSPRFWSNLNFVNFVSWPSQWFIWLAVVSLSTFSRFIDIFNFSFFLGFCMFMTLIWSLSRSFVYKDIYMCMCIWVSFNDLIWLRQCEIPHPVSGGVR